MIKNLIILFIVAVSPLCAQETGLTKSSNFQVSSDVVGPYKMAEVDYSINPVLTDENIFFHISLPEGMELPEKFSTKVTHNTASLEFTAKIIDQKFFLDSDEDPLTEFKVKIVARNTPQGAVFMTTVDLLVVNERGDILVDTKSSSCRQIATYKSSTVEIDEMPGLFNLEDSRQEGYVQFKRAPRIVCGMPATK